MLCGVLHGVVFLLFFEVEHALLAERKLLPYLFDVFHWYALLMCAVTCCVEMGAGLRTNWCFFELSEKLLIIAEFCGELAKMVENELKHLS